MVQFLNAMVKNDSLRQDVFVLVLLGVATMLAIVAIIVFLSDRRSRTYRVPMATRMSRRERRSRDLLTARRTEDNAHRIASTPLITQVKRDRGL